MYCLPGAFEPSVPPGRPVPDHQCQIRGILGTIVYNFLRLGGVVIRYHLPDE